MDDIVVRSMLKWPDVPSVYGWLRLDRRGRWLIRMPERTAGTVGGAPAVPASEPRFERIVNPAMIEFIGRNYTRDAQGRYFFQNGPQRVYVAMECTPWIYRLDGSDLHLVTHTGVAAGAPREAYFDERGGLILVCDPGVGAVLDLDLSALLDRFTDGAGQPFDVEALIRGAQHASGVKVRLLNAAVTVGSIRAGDLPSRFGYVQHPAPPPGQPDC